MLGLRKPNFKRKIIHFEKSHNTENCEETRMGTVPKKNRMGTLETLKTFRKKTKIENFNSLIVPKNLKGGTLWDFLTFVLL